MSRGFDAAGRRLQARVANFENKRAAQSAFAKTKTQHDQGEFVETSRVRFARWLDEWLTGREQRGDIKRSTLDNYRRYVAQDIAPSALGRLRLRLTDIKRPDVRQFVDPLVAAGRGATTVRRIIAVVQGAHTAAMRDDIIAAIPAHGVRLPTVDAHEFEPWTPVQVGAFLDRAAQHRLGALFEVAVMTGLRRAELVGLRWATSILRNVNLRCAARATKRAVRSSSAPSAKPAPIVALGG